MKKNKLFVNALALFALSISAFGQSTEKIGTIYTDIAWERCKSLEEKRDTLVYVKQCKGAAGYMLNIGDYDARQTIDVIAPDGKRHELRFNKVVSPSFSYVGDTAEWRVRMVKGKIEPIALIVRFNFKINPAISSKEASYLVVSKITEDATCVTDFVKPSKDQNIKARKLADTSAQKPCAKEYPWYKK